MIRSCTQMFKNNTVNGEILDMVRRCGCTLANNK